VPSISCSKCHVAREIAPSRTGTLRTPKGWKVLGDAPYCSVCKLRAYMLRAVVLPVAGPLGATWDELRDALRSAWGDTTRCANWMMTELYARDVRRGPGDRRLARMPSIYLYPEARRLFPRLSSQAVASLAHDVHATYRARRFDVLWTGARSLSTYKYPTPCPVPAQAWSLRESSGTWLIALRLGDRRWTLRLRGGPHMRHQAERLRQILSGTAERGAASIFEVAARPADGRSGLIDGGSRVMIKIAAWLPRPEPGTRERVIRVRSAPEAVLAVDEDRWRIDATPMRGVLSADARRRTALVTNLGLERGTSRQSRRRREGIQDALADLSRRSRSRIADACRTYAAHVAAHARRRHAAVLEYDDSHRGALPHFPWEELRRRVAEKLDEHGIEFVHVNARFDAGAAARAAHGDDKDAA
jgi:hypothetical protein